MNKKGIWVITSIVVIMSLLLGVLGCAAPATPSPTPTSTPTTTVTPKPTSTPTTTPTSTPTVKPTSTPTSTPTPVKPIELKLSHYLTPTYHLSVNVFEPMVQEIEKRSGGRVKITIYPSAVLGVAQTQFDMTIGGAIDIVWYPPSYAPGRFPLSDIAELPFAVPDVDIGQKAIWEIYKKGHLDKEFSQVKVLTLATTSPYQLLFTKAKPQTIADLKGLKMRTPGGSATDALKVAGMVPVPLAAPEMYTSMERGVIDGAPFTYSGSLGYKLQEITKNLIEANLSVTTVGIYMNKDVFARLPKDIQQIIEEVGEKAGRMIVASYEKVDGPGKDAFIKAGASVYTLPPAERTKWIQLTKPIWDNWVANAESKGAAGKVVYNEMLSILKRLGVALPF